MTEHLREALAVLRFNSAETPDDVWRASPSHVDGLHSGAEHRIKASIEDARASTGPSPVGLVLQGEKGVGKTHLLGSVRRMVQRKGGYFFLAELSTGDAFWDDVAEAMRSELHRPNDEGERQLAVLMRQLCMGAAVPEEVSRAMVGEAPLTPDDVRLLLNGLRKVDSRIAVECGDTIRALALYGSDHAEVGLEYLQGREGAQEDRRLWGMQHRSKSSQVLVRDISRILALTGPCVIGVDQLDTLVHHRGQGAIDSKMTAAELTGDIQRIAQGLMHLRQVTQRTLTIVACLPNTWMHLKQVSTDTVADRFTTTPILGSIADGKLARQLVEKWLGVIYQSNGISPPHPTWPVAQEAFGKAWTPHTPRQLLKRIHAHAETCLHGEIRELSSFDEEIEVPTVPAVPESDYDFAELDAQFDRLRDKADIASAEITRENEDEVAPPLFLAGLKSWITEVGNDDLRWHPEPLADDNRLHAGLRRILNDALDTQEQWTFRLITEGHGITVLRRMRSAREAAGIRAGVQDRHLVLIRRGTRGWTGPTTKKEFTELTEQGVRRLDMSDDDLRTFSALKEMLATPTHRLLTWLAVRKPASTKTFLRHILPGSPQAKAGHQETRPPPVVGQAPPEPGQLVLGMDGEIRIELESLRKHAIVFAGSGSGKTVLLRRIVEECALNGVSAIVLDPNNDLARLGDAWPEPPEDWRPGDERKAVEYLDSTEVVVWTPGRTSGRPLSFHPLPDFAEVRQDADEFAASVEAAVARLVPHAKVANDSKGAVRGRAVLREALAHYARTGKRDLTQFIEVLAELPEGVSKLNTAAATAADLAETLRAATVNDPLLGGPAEATDPASLLTPAAGKRARISVISFVGLPSEEQRQAFVSQLQWEVFAWIKRHPATDRPLGGLFVMDEAQTIAPSGTWTASTQSTILLASQARKYGLGLLLATQAPKGVHNQVVGNATTQFFGRLNSPAQIAAATEMARAKNSSVGNISRLERGHFYATGENFGFRRMRVPLCLSHHPPSPLRLEEVLDRARAR
ncbi:ATP-binding protein [Amycolatopsis sp. 195334CR]|uniref:ATP-binding protein n=1 Tax=Amycolatopsis sp. 195334CR TaxID=2814588 RepID=UPI001A8F2B29|nr:ATP-binding protein [Amycolatopsis sp. 195334CR]MBN6034744.1 ATP-binding protein [Amycolatopsis sp. 195334CR]